MKNSKNYLSKISHVFVISSLINFTAQANLKDFAIDIKNKSIQKASTLSCPSLSELSSSTIETFGSAIKAVNNFNDSTLKKSREFEQSLFDFAKYCKTKATRRELIVYSLAAFGGAYLGRQVIKKLHSFYKPQKKNK